MMKLQLFFFIFAFALSSLLAAEKQTSDDKQDQLLKRLEILDAQGQRQINLKRLAPLSDNDEGRANKIQAAVIEGAVLIDPQGQNFFTKKYLYVWGIVRENNPYIFYILNAQGEVAFQTHTRFIVPIRSDLSMDPTPQVYKEVVHTPNRYSYEKKLHFEVLPRLGVESMSFSSAQSYTGAAGGQSIGQRAELGLLFPINLPIKPGIFSSFQSGMGSSDNADFNYSSLDIGPMLQIKLHTKLLMTVSGGKSLFFRSNFTINNGEQMTGSYDSTFGGVALDYRLDSSWGPFQVGIGYKLYTLNAAESTEPISASARHQQNTLFGLYLSRPVEFSL